MSDATLRGSVDAVVYTSPDHRFVTLQLIGDEGETRVIGDLAGLGVGDTVRFTGSWEEHPKHGRQFRANAVIPELPTTAEGIEKMLASGIVEGVGTGIARRIVECFGLATLDVIMDHPERLREITGVGPERAKKIQDAFRTRRDEAEVRAFLQATGMGNALTQRVMKAYGAGTAQRVRENPYSLAMEIDGIGFRTADQIASGLGIAQQDPRRARGAVLHLVAESASDGHTGIPIEMLREGLIALEVPLDIAHEAVTDLATNRALEWEHELFYTPALYDAEVRLANEIRGRTTLDPIDPAVFDEPAVVEAMEPLHPLQRAAVQAATDHALVVITGGPGTGKTTTVKTIVTLMKAAGRTISLAAPTGRAARRMTEATGEPAQTIHRLLEWNPTLHAFQRNAGNRLPADMVLIDEVSMLDVKLAASLFAAIHPQTRVVLVGDADQLPSVGPGTLLADLLATDWIPSVRLTEVFRQASSSAIVRGAHRVLHGEEPEPSAARGGVQAPPAGEFFVVVEEDAARAAQKLVDLVAGRIPHAFGLDPVRDVQVLVPTYRGPLGADALNDALQQRLNPLASQRVREKGPKRAPFLPGDKVMQLKNDYDLNVYNGDIGTIATIHDKTIRVVMEGRGEVEYTEGKDQALTLAYAATVHKAQGSEYPAVVIGLHPHHYMLLQRALLYTAITRARSLVVLVGSRKALQMAVRNAKRADRFGALRLRLGKAMEPP